MYMTIQGGEMQIGYVGTDCWNVTSGVVLDCPAGEAKMVPTQLYVTALEGLYPLKDPSVKVAYSGPGEVNGKATEGINVAGPAAPVSVRLDFYKDSGLLARSEYAGSFAGTPGQVVHEVLTYREVDGVQFQRKTVMSVGGKQIMEDMFISASEKIDVRVFERPKQRDLGVASVRTEGAQAVAYVVHKGAYEGIGASLAGMMTWISEAGLDAVGPPTFVYLARPEEGKNPAGNETEIRVPVTATKDVTASHEVYQIKMVEETSVATQLEKGSYDKAAAGFGVLAAWCSENGYVITGPPMMTGYSDPSLTPPEELLNEIKVPVRKGD